MFTRGGTGLSNLDRDIDTVYTKGNYMTTGQIMNKREAARELGLAVSTIKKYLEQGVFPNAQKVPDGAGSKRLRWDIPESDILNFQAPGGRGAKPKPSVSVRRHITLEPDIDEWLERQRAAGVKVSELVNRLLREEMGREGY